MSKVNNISGSVKISSDIKEIKAVSSRIVNLLMERKVDKSDIFDVRLSLEESLLNAIEHGNKKDKNLSVNISFVIDETKILITIEDEGRGFSHKELPDPTTDENILRSHGRGIYLIHKLMDEVRYNDGGNKVQLTKYIR